MKNIKLLIYTFFLIPALVFGQSDSLSVKDSVYYKYYIKKDVALITGYQIQKKDFLEIGVGIIEDGLVGRHPSTLIYGISNELRLSKDFI